MFRFRITVSRRGRRLSPEWVCRRRFAAAQARTIAPKSSGSGPGREPQVTHYEHVRNLGEPQGDRLRNTDAFLTIISLRLLSGLPQRLIARPTCPMLAASASRRIAH